MFNEKSEMIKNNKNKNLSKIYFRDVEVKKSEVRMKSENLHPWYIKHKI